MCRLAKAGQTATGDSLAAACRRRAPGHDVSIRHAACSGHARVFGGRARAASGTLEGRAEGLASSEGSPGGG